MSARWRLERTPADEARALWIAAICTLLFGLHAVESRYEPPIAAARVRADRFYDEMLANERLVRQAAVLRRAEHAAAADLRRISRDDSISSTTASLIDRLTRISRVRHVTLLSVQPQNAPLPEGTMPSTAVSIAVRGRFPALLQFIEELSHGGTLMRVTGAQIAVASAPQKRNTEPLLDAGIQTILYRPHMPAEEGRNDGTHR